MAIRCVFFDFDGVLRNWEYDQESLKTVFGIPIDAFREVAFAPENVVPAIRGEITDEQWRANVGQIMKTRFPDRDVEAATTAWDRRTGELVPEVLDIVRECKLRLPVGLITNATSKLNDDLESLDIEDLFDHVVNASEIGSIKPEPEIYLHALKLAEVEPQEAFFTDDKPEHVEAAKLLGYVGHTFESAQGLRTALTKAEVL